MCRGHQVALDLARGLAHLHQQNIVHLDIKSGVGSAKLLLSLSVWLPTISFAVQPTFCWTYEGRAKIADAGHGAPHPPASASACVQR